MIMIMIIIIISSHLISSHQLVAHVYLKSLEVSLPPVRVSSEARRRRLHPVGLDVRLVHDVQAQTIANLQGGGGTVESRR